MRQNLKGQDMLLEEKRKILELSKFSILTYTRNRKLGNLKKRYFTSNFNSSCNLRCKNDKKLTESKTCRSAYTSRRKIENSEIENSEISESVPSLQVLTVVVIKLQKN